MVCARDVVIVVVIYHVRKGKETCSDSRKLNNGDYFWEDIVVE